MCAAYSHNSMTPKHLQKEADTFLLFPPSHRSASMTARLVLCVCITPNGSCRLLLYLSLGEDHGPRHVERAQPLGRPPPSAAICRSRSCRWLGAASRYALPFSVQVLTLLCHPRFPGAGFVTPTRAYQREGNDAVSTRTTPLSLRGAATEISCYFVIGRCVKP